MTEQADWIPSGVDLGHSSIARVYDYFLGGAHNFAVDRQAAEQILQLMPEVALIARSNRSFLRRAVDYCLASGVRQFLDLGSGIPTVGNVHEIAQKFDPQSKVVYVDIEQVAISHAELILKDNPNAQALLADVADSDTILNSPQVQELIDFSEPVAVLMVSVLPFVPDSADPHGLVATYRSHLVPGSFVVLAHTPFTPDSSQRDAAEEYSKKVANVTLRSEEEIRRFFTGFELISPGLVRSHLWRPDPSTDIAADAKGIDLNKHASLSGVGRLIAE